jgi:hypothetical protein
MGSNCESCDYFNDGIRETGATPVLAWLIDQIQKLFKRIREKIKCVHEFLDEREKGDV